MISEKDRAETLSEATAQKHTIQTERYKHSRCKSSVNLKQQIGTMLLALQASLSKNQQKEYWVQFEPMLEQYLDFRCSGVLL